MISLPPSAKQNDSVESLVFAEQVYTLYRMAGVGLIATGIIAALVALIAWNKTNNNAITLWLIAMLMVCGACAVVLHKFRREEPDAREIGKWYRLAFGGAMAAAAVWGIAGYVLAQATDTSLAVLMLVTLAGVAAGALPALAAVWHVYAAYCIILLLPVALALVTRGESQWLTAAMLVVVFTAAMLLFAWHHATTLANALQLGFRNDALARHALAEKERVEALNASLQVDMAQHQHAQQELTRTKEAAEAAAHAKSAFLASISHEIRTPLHSLVGLANLAIKENPPEPVNNHITKMLAAAHSLMGTISNVLDVSRIESGKLTIEKTRFRLRDIVDNIQAIFSALAQEKNLALNIVFDPAFPRYVAGDPVRVGQVLSNFAGNAIKFTEAGSVTVDVRAISRGPAKVTARLSVADTGPGLTEEQQKALFDSSAPGAANASQTATGAGLGLIICRQLVAAMGGRIGVESEPGKGSKFWMELPLELAVDETRTLEAGNESKNIDLAGLKVLLVEDNKINQLVASTLLQKQGVKVTIVNNGQEALDSALHGGDVYDAVLMDLHMPVMDGREATLALRQKFNRSQLPIIALTANALASEQAACIELGMNDYLTKPIVPVDLFRAIHAVSRGATAAG